MFSPEFLEPSSRHLRAFGGNPLHLRRREGRLHRNRVTSFVISHRFNLDWMQSFGLRLFHTLEPRIYRKRFSHCQVDIEQDREPEADSPLWFLLKISLSEQFDWSRSNLSWLLTKAIFSTGKLNFGIDAAEKLDQASLAFATALTSAAGGGSCSFVLGHLSDPAARESSYARSLGPAMHTLIGSPKFGEPTFIHAWLWHS